MIDLENSANDELSTPETIINENVNSPEIKPIKINLMTCLFLFLLGLWI